MTRLILGEFSPTTDLAGPRRGVFCLSPLLFMTFFVKEKCMSKRRTSSARASKRTPSGKIAKAKNTRAANQPAVFPWEKTKAKKKACTANPPVYIRWDDIPPEEQRKIVKEKDKLTVRGLLQRVARIFNLNEGEITLEIPVDRFRFDDESKDSTRVSPRRRKRNAR